MRPPIEKVKGIKEKSEEMNYGQVEREVCKHAVVTNSQVEFHRVEWCLYLSFSLVILGERSKYKLGREDKMNGTIICYATCFILNVYPFCEIRVL